MQRFLSRIIPSLFLLCISLCAHASNGALSVDSLKTALAGTQNKALRIETMARIMEQAYRSDPEMAVGIDKQILVEAHALNDSKLLSWAYLCTGKLFILKDSFSLAQTHLDKCLQYARKAKQPDVRAEVYDAMGALQDKLGNYDKAMANHLKAVNWYEKAGDKQGMANTNKYLGILQARQEKHEEALKYFKKALDIDCSIQNEFGMGQSYNNVGICYYKLGQKEVALPYFRASIYYKKKSGNRRGLGSTVINLGEYHNYKQNYDSAMFYLNQCLQLADEVQSTYQRIGTLLIRGNTWMGLKNPGNAITDWEEAYKLSNVLGLKREKSDALKNLANVYTSTSQHAKALQRLNEYITVKDSLLNEENSHTMLQMQARFDTEKKDKEIQLLNKDKKNAAAIRNADNARSRVIIYSILGGLLLVVVFSFFLFKRFRVSQKQNAIIENQKQLVEEKQKEIVDSINYAKRLQEAILPSEKQWKKSFPESFILYKPKDIVAGDFYFMETVGNQLIVAVGDCTGHGVPGAMVSVVCSNALSRSIKEFGLTDPGKILDKTRELVLETFSANESDVKDGMDISLCSISLQVSSSTFQNNMKPETATTLLFAGANNPLWILRSSLNEILEIKGDKQPIGQFERMNPFTTHRVQIQKGDVLYLTTDGYTDQFGGDKGKKLKASNLRKLLVTLGHMPVTAQAGRIDEVFETWRGGLEQVDDVCVAGIRL